MESRWRISWKSCPVSIDKSLKTMPLAFSSAKGRLVITLPLTTPTGVVRAKRPVPGRLAEPVATRSRPMAAEDTLEWQINYDTDDAADPSAVLSAVRDKPSGRYYGSELVWLLAEGHRQGLITAAEWKDLARLLAEVPEPGQTIEDGDAISRQPAPRGEPGPPEHYGWTRHTLHVPDYERSGPGYSVLVRLEKKQRAVGLQAMIYLYLHLATAELRPDQAPFAERLAEKEETVDYPITAQNRHLIRDVTLAFAFASAEHRAEVSHFFQQLGKKGGGK
jgi:hypothetical protein